MSIDWRSQTQRNERCFHLQVELTEEVVEVADADNMEEEDDEGDDEEDDEDFTEVRPGLFQVSRTKIHHLERVNINQKW